MKRLLIALVLLTVLAACQSDDPNPKISLAPGEVSFGVLAGMNEKQYLLEQHALFRSELQDNGVESLIDGNVLKLNIPGNIAFDINSAKMNWNVHSVLDKISPVLQEYQHTSILVLGHSDARGDRDINQLLSEQRARTIRDYFIRSGVAIERITSKGLGSGDLLIQNDITTLDRSLNRRITLEITVNQVEQ